MRLPTRVIFYQRIFQRAKKKRGKREREKERQEVGKEKELEGEKEKAGMAGRKWSWVEVDGYSRTAGGAQKNCKCELEVTIFLRPSRRSAGPRGINLCGNFRQEPNARGF